MIITLAQVAEFLPNTIKSTLQNEARFSSIANSALLIVQEKTGLLGTDALPDWAILPTAWIIGYVAAEQFGNMSSELLDRTRTNYNNAIRLLETKRTNTVRNSKRGTFGERAEL